MPLRNVLYEKSKDHSHKEKDSKFTILITGGVEEQLQSIRKLLTH